MGRDRALPRGFFGFIDPKTHIPRNNVLLIGALCLVGGYIISYQLGAELLNFGAFIGFMGVNVAAFLRYWVRARHKTLGNLLPPVLGFLICLAIWLSLRPVAKLFGALWLALGIAYGAWRTRGFRDPSGLSAGRMITPNGVTTPDRCGTHAAPGRNSRAPRRPRAKVPYRPEWPDRRHLLQTAATKASGKRPKQRQGPR